MTDVRTLLHDLAADAPRGHGEDTADRVVDLHRAQDRRRLRRAGVAAAVAVVVAVTPVALDRLRTDGTAVAAAAPARATSLVDVATRGSLADDPTVVAAATGASWNLDTPMDGPSSPALADRHVVFAGQVPGGQVWALVMGPVGDRLGYAWFTDVDPGSALDLQLATAPGTTTPGLPLALLDTAGDHAPMVVVALPDQDVVLSAGQEATVRSFEAQGGVALADVTTTGPDLTIPLYQLTGPGSDVVRGVTTFDSSRQPAGYSTVVPVPAVDPVDAGAFTGCMEAGGWVVGVLDDGTVTYGYRLGGGQLDELVAAGQACAASLTTAYGVGD